MINAIIMQDRAILVSCLADCCLSDSLLAQIQTNFYDKTIADCDKTAVVFSAPALFRNGVS